jgi:hypothetical protein
MDDFPVTGTFLNPSTGSGIRSKVPSFYFYDESVGGLQAGWTPYPTSGNASMNPLAVGVGYAAFIRKGAGPTVWDVTGALNQGEISLPVMFTPQGEPSNGWNLVGNPYPCAIDWDINGASGWTKNNLSNVISIRDNGNGGGTFHYWDGDDNYDDIFNGQIATGQSFWVRATDVNPVLVIREATKAIDGAEFFRNESQQIPSFSLMFRRGNLSDRVFFKIRSDANDGIDDWDAIKLDNEQFDISILSAADSLSLAIDATNVIPCGSRVFQIITKDLVPGSYQLILQCKFDMKNFRYTLIDQYFHKEITLTPDDSITLNVDSDKGSMSWDRFVLRLDELVMDITVDVEAGNVLCPDSALPVTIKHPQAGVWYSVGTAAGQLLTGEKVAGDGDILFMVDAGLLQHEMDTLVVIARSVCTSIELAARLPVKVEPRFEDVEVVVSPVCPEMPVLLSIPIQQPDLDYYWFESASSPDTLAKGFQFFTPPITAPTTFFVAAVRVDGCISRRHPTHVEPSPYDPASIGWVDSLTLSSNFTTNNQWYLNGMTLAGEVDQYLQIRSSGKYSVSINLPGCTLKDTMVVSRAMYSYLPGSFWLYPNPVRSSLVIRSKGESIVEVEVMDELGRCVDRIGPNALSSHGYQAILDTSSLGPGVYIAHIKGVAGYGFLRFVKTE